MRWPPKYKVKKAAFVKKDGRYKLYRCALCKGEFPSGQTVVDHIKPVIAVTKGFVDWNEYINRMFVAEKGYQVLCKVKCHGAKTKAENKQRRKKRKKKK